MPAAGELLEDAGAVDSAKLRDALIRAAQTLIIETNHDEKLLQNDTKRPWSVKQRIMSRHGHLSNAAAANALADLIGGRLRRAVLGHLSRDCNSPVSTTGHRSTAHGRAKFSWLSAGRG